MVKREIGEGRREKKREKERSAREKARERRGSIPHRVFIDLVHPVVARCCDRCTVGVDVAVIVRLLCCDGDETAPYKRS